MARSVRAVILAGGETSNPLTRHRAMPAVPIGSALKLIDIPINNCMQAGVNKIYVLTQFQSHTLNSHISSTYPPVQFAGPEGCGWVDVLAAMQTATEKDGWYTGSADAIRKNINELKDEARGIAPATDYIILSGSAVYTLDMGRVLAYHRARNADVTMVTSLVSEELAPTKGIAQVHQSSGRVLKFEEKPSASSLKGMYSEINEEDGSQSFMANMGIYIFKREALFELLSSTHPAKSQAITHIGHHVIPNALASGMKVHAYHHKGYWHDVSTLRDYYEANLDLAKDDAGVKQFEVEQGVSQTKGRMLPPAIMQGDVFVKSSLIDDGAVLVDCRVTNSVIGEKMFVGPGSVVENSLLLGSLNWTNQSLRAKAQSQGERVYGIGSNCVIRDCILDKNVTIGDNVQISNAENVQELDRADSHGYMIQDGIVVVMRGAIIPDGTVI
jgi:glucose-1-phosphate adenylyltransferase